MKIKIECEPENKLEIIIRCAEITAEVEKIISMLEGDECLIGKLNSRIHQIKLDDIYYFEVSEDHLFAYCKDNVYEMNLRLYELEERLARKYFVRISKSILLNLNKLDSVKALLNGRYEAKLINNERLIINRHYVSSFKRKFGM